MDQEDWKGTFLFFAALYPTDVSLYSILQPYTRNGQTSLWLLCVKFWVVAAYNRGVARTRDPTRKWREAR